MPKFVPLLLALTFTAAPLFGQDVRITEFLANNVNSIKDEDGEAKPWLEIWNNARSPTNATVPVKAVLTGWKLTNGTVTWVFPAFELPPEEHVIIWASGKDRRVSTAPLHTNFVLDPQAGGTLTLLRPDPATPGTDIVVSTFINYPAQQADVSYGGDRANPTLEGVYATPTPGATNNFSGPGVAGKLVFSVPSKAFTGGLEVTLTQVTPDPAAEIWYTTNRADPTTVESVTNIKYTGPITITATQMIRARVFKPGLLPGESDAQCYLLLDTGSANPAANFSTALPLVAITTFGVNPLTVAENVDVPAYMWVWEPKADDQGVLRSRLSDLPDLATRVAVDRRGSSTGGNAKMNLNVEARKSHNDEDKDIVMLGMPNGADWVFHAPFQFDRTLLHNPLAMALSNVMGRYASRTRMAEVMIDINQGALTMNAAGSPDYYGVYNIMEKIRRENTRVDVTKLDMYDNSALESSGGYIWKIDRVDPGESLFSAGGQSFAYYYPKWIDITTPQRAPQRQFLTGPAAAGGFINSFNAALNSATYTDPVTGYAAWLDVPAALDHHVHNVWTFNVDALRLSGYMHKDRDTVINGVQTRSKLVYGPQWDFDRALASTDGRDANPVTWRSTSGDLGTDFFNYPWWFRLFGDIDFYQKYIDRWVELRRGAFSQQSVNALIDALNAPLLNPTNPAANGEGVMRDLARWNQIKRGGTVNYPAPPGGSVFTASYPATQAGEIQRMKDWLQVRANFFDSQWVAPVTITPNPGSVIAGTAVALSAAAGSTIYYTTDGSDPRPAGGGPPTTALTYTEPIAINATTRIKARAYNASWLTNAAVRIGANNPRLRSAWSGPTDARFATEAPATAGSLIVTEVHYHAGDPTTVELFANSTFVDGDFEFIELKNVGGTSIDLNGVKLSSGVLTSGASGAGDPVTGAAFTFTGDAAISLAPGEFAIVAKNPQAFVARYGNKPRLLGPYTGTVDNAGARIVLVGANGQTITDFTYDDAWYPTTDGPGRSLVVYDETAADSAFSTAENWRPSAAEVGSPGLGEPPFVTTLSASAVTATSVQLHAEVSPNGTVATVEFALSSARSTAAEVPANSSAITVDTTVTELSAHTLYTFRAEATNVFGVRVGEEMTFTTLNRSPEVQDTELHIPSRAPIAIQVLGSGLDVDGDELVISALTQGQEGTVSTDGKELTYTPSASYTGNDAFTFTVSDGFGGTDSATVTLRNAAPAALADSVTVNGEAITLDPRVNDTDPETDALTVSSVSQGAFGTVTIASPQTVTYTPGPQFFGSDAFTYTITDGSASASATVVVRSTSPIALVGPSTGAQVPGAPPGTVYDSIGLPTTGVFLGKMQSVAGSEQAIFAADGTIRLKVGDPAPEIPGATIGSLQEPSGQAVVAVLRGALKSNDTVLYVGLNEGPVRIGAREGDVLTGGATLKRFLSIDGNGAAVFFRASLTGPGVNSKNDIALAAVVPESGLRLLAREGDLVQGRPISVLSTLVGATGTLAEGRWRSGSEEIGVRLSFPDKAQMLYTIPAIATSSDEWTVWGKTGDQYVDRGTAQTFGLPGFAFGGASHTAQLIRGLPATVTSSNDSVLLSTTEQGSVVLASEGGPVPGSDGTSLPGLTYKKFSDPVAGANGRTAFAATLSGPNVAAVNRTGLWLSATDGSVRLLARTGDLAPGGGRWAAFESLVLPDGPQSGPLFTARLAISAADGVTKQNDRALWGVDSAGNLRLLLRTGEAVMVSGNALTTKSFVALPPGAGSFGSARGFDDEQRVTALLDFTNGTQVLLNIAVP